MLHYKNKFIKPAKALHSKERIWLSQKELLMRLVFSCIFTT